MWSSRATFCVRLSHHVKCRTPKRLAQREARAEGGARRPLWMDTWVMDGGGAPSHVDWKMLP